jgi:hypothetical protein
LPLQVLRNYTLACAAALALSACSSEREPAQQLMGQIEGAVSAASEDAAKYAPDQLIAVQTKLDDLKTAYNAQDFKRVLAQGKPLLAQAQELAVTAAANKAELAKDLNDQWSSLSASLPNVATAIQSRIDFLSEKKNKKLAAGIDLDGAKSALSDATSQWSKAQGAFGNGNMSEAVAAAKDVKSKLDALTVALKMDAAGASATPP